MNLSSLLAAAAGLALAASGAQAYTLDFGGSAPPPTICSDTGDGAGAVVGCVNYGHVSQSYGDVSGVVDVQYRAPDITVDTRSLSWWATDYNDLYGVLWADSGAARIDLLPTAGGGITLTHFDLGAYPNTTLQTTVTVSDLATSAVLFTYTGNVGGSTHSSFDQVLASTGGLRIEFKDQAYNVGIDNISFTVGTVPEPATTALLLAGLAGIASVARRRRG